jgi:hypothetical protein
MRCLSYRLIKIHRQFTSASLLCDKASLKKCLKMIVENLRSIETRDESSYVLSEYDSLVGMAYRRWQWTCWTITELVNWNWSIPYYLLSLYMLPGNASRHPTSAANLFPRFLHEPCIVLPKCTPRAVFLLVSLRSSYVIRLMVVILVVKRASSRRPLSHARRRGFAALRLLACPARDHFR